MVRMDIPQQGELPIRVAICAWCKPKNRAGELGAELGSISHGICARHLKQFKLELQKRKGVAPASPAAVGRTRRSKTLTIFHPELNYHV